MSAPHLIGPTMGGTPTPASGSGRGAATLPGDLLRQASRRLEIMLLLGAALWVIGTLLDRLAILAGGGEGRGMQLQPEDAIAALNVLVSLAIFFHLHSRAHEPGRVLSHSRWYLLFTAFSLGMIWHWDAPPVGVSVFPLFSWVGVVVLIFAAIVPSPPGWTLLTGLIAASMNPINMLIARARGVWDFGPTSAVLVMHYPDFILVGVAVVISRVVTGLGRQVAQARAMGSYQLGELLGQGGMGQVYRATHRMLARSAAIKLIRPEALGTQNTPAAAMAVQRFRREAEVAASLRSPHTVELYDFGVTDDQTLYFVMELLDGMDLETLVRETGPVPAARVIHILRQVCESLAEAHARGLVHRDIKPANIHLGRLGLQHDFVKVLDFGLVKSVVAPAAEASLLTGANTIQGTPAYMAPEMVLGDSYDGRADLYALGCVAYYLLTGEMVFTAPDALRLLGKHVSEAPVPPSQRTELPVPAALEAVVLACLAKKPEQRPAGALELSHALEAIDGERWGEPQARQWWRTHRPAAPA